MLKNNKGFSLIEILVTVGLIGILVSIAVPSYQGYKRNTIKMAMKADVGNGQKVYSAKYAMDGEYCYTFDLVGLSKDKSTSPIYKNKGFYGFGNNGTCKGIDIKDVQFISDGTGTCSISGHSDKASCKAANNDNVNGVWATSSDTDGENAPSCVLSTNSFTIGAYSNVSSLDTFIQANEEGKIEERQKEKNCF